MLNSKNTNNKSKKVAYGGITIVLSCICLYLSCIIPTNKIILFSLSTVFISIMVIEFGIFSAFSTYISSSLLAFIIIPNKLIIIPYVLFFGYYGIVKHYIERLSNIVLEWLVKISLFNVMVILVYFIIDKLMGVSLDKTYIFIKITLLQLIFIIYDYVYSALINYYIKKVMKKSE